MSLAAPSALYLVFLLGESRFALHLAVVEQAVRRVDIAALPGAPPIVLGAINWRGRMVPVVNLHRRLDLPEPSPSLDQTLILCRTARRSLALLADRVSGVVECDRAQITPAPQVMPGLAHVAGLVALEGDVVLIHDLETCLSLPEEAQLSEAMEGR